MAGSTLASPTAERRGGAGRARGRSRRGWRRGGASAATGWRCSSVVDPGRDGAGRPARRRSFWQVPINEIDFTARLKGPSLAHPFGTDDLGQDLLARMLYGGRISLAVGVAAMVVAIVVGTIIGAIAGMSRGWVGAGLDVADRPVPVAAAAAAAAARHLPVPRPAQGRARARGRRLHPDRPRDRRLALDAGGAAGARAVPLAAREGVRRGRARARRLASRARSCATSCRMRSAR